MLRPSGVREEAEGISTRPSHASLGALMLNGLITQPMSLFNDKTENKETLRS